MYNKQQFHGVMRMLGFKGNYQLKMANDDEAAPAA